MTKATCRKMSSFGVTESAKWSKFAEVGAGSGGLSSWAVSGNQRGVIRFSQPTLGAMLSPTRAHLLNFPKQCHQLGTGSSDGEQLIETHHIRFVRNQSCLQVKKDAISIFLWFPLMQLDMGKRGYQSDLLY